jgi:hypothetical protein
MAQLNQIAKLLNLSPGQRKQLEQWMKRRGIL